MTKQMTIKVTDFVVREGGTVDRTKTMEAFGRFLKELATNFTRDLTQYLEGEAVWEGVFSEVVAHLYIKYDGLGGFDKGTLTTMATRLVSDREVRANAEAANDLMRLARIQNAWVAWWKNNAGNKDDVGKFLLVSKGQGARVQIRDKDMAFLMHMDTYNNTFPNDPPPGGVKVDANPTAHVMNVEDLIAQSDPDEPEIIEHNPNSTALAVLG